MKITILSLTCFLSTAVSAIPATQAAPELTVRDTPEGTIDCGFCTCMFDFCVQVSDHIPSLRWNHNTDQNAERSHSRSRRLKAVLP